jgi:hypothetical protein
MIHYTLLPEIEIRRLKREYRTRLAISFLFFVSCAILVGVGSLIPAYIYSYSEEKTLIDKIAILQKSREESGADPLIKELKSDNEIIKIIKNNKETYALSKVVSQIIGHKPKGLTINSFNMVSKPNATSSIALIIQGKSATREALIQLKNSLESDPLILNVDLPVSDLAKNKDIVYTIKLSIISNI